MFRTVVVSLKLVSAEYFMHRMTNLELDMMAQQLEFSDRPLWDAARIISMYVVAPYSKRKLNAKRLFPLPWDNQDEEVDKDGFKAIQARMDDFAKTL